MRSAEVRRGIWVNRKPAALVPEISVRDARKIAAGDMDETVTVKEAAARQRVEEILRGEERRMTLLKAGLRQPPQSREEFVSWQRLQEEERIWKECRAVLQKNPSPRWMIFPDGSNLVYDFALGYAHFYVDARSGKVDIHREVFY